MNKRFPGREVGRAFSFFVQGNNNKEIPLTNYSNNSSHLFSTSNVSDVVLNIFTYLVSLKAHEYNYLPFVGKKSEAQGGYVIC